jgi:hypothetical protein
VRDLAGAWRSAILAYIPDDHGTVAESELCAVVLPDPHPLDETEGRAQPGDRLAYIGIDQNGDDRRRRDGPIRPCLTA